MRGEHLTIQLLWATAQLLVKCVSLTYLVDEFFIFLFLVLLKEVRTRGESKISSFYFCVLCKSRELGGWRSPRFPYVTQVVERFFSHLLRAIISYWAKSHLETCQKHPRWSSSEKITNGFSTSTTSAEKLHRKCSTRPWICLWLKVLLMWSMAGLQLYRICCCSEVFEAPPNYKKS